MKQKQMKIRFEGQTHQIDANTLINVLIHYQNIVEIANREFGNEEKRITIKVNAIEKGSFVVDIDLCQNIVQQLFSSEGMSYVSDLMGVIGGVFGVYHFFKGKPVKTEEDKAQATKILGKEVGLKQEFHTQTIHVYNAPITREAISKSIETADSDISVEGISIHGASKNPIQFEKKDFKDYMYNDFDKEKDIPNERLVYDNDAYLVILSLGFEKGDKWNFLYQGFKIPIVNKDDALLKLIDQGLRFGKGDAIRVRLKKIQRFDKTFQAYVNYSYKIDEFYEHIPAPTQGNLFD